MQGILPDKKLAPTRVNPKILLLYGKPKVGKTSKISELESCLNLDFEKGADMYTSMRLPMCGITGPTTYNEKKEITGVSLDTVFNEIVANGTAQAAAGKTVEFPYKVLVVDTIDKLEDYCEIEATVKYKNSVIGKKFEGDSVLELPNGAGYHHLRKEMLYQIDRLTKVCKYLILVAHVKDKLLDKGGVQVESQDISLTGRLGAIVCAKTDAIGYVYRDHKKPLMVSFATSQGAVMGSRGTRLSGQTFEFDWTKIYLDEPGIYPIQ